MTTTLSHYLHVWARAHPEVKNAIRLPNRLWSPFRVLGLRKGVAAYRSFLRDFVTFREDGGRAPVKDLFPVLHDKIQTQPIDAHYFHQAIWATKKIQAAQPDEHLDIGSQAIFAGILTAITNVIYIDLRPLGIEVEGLSNRKGTILELPMADRTVRSISCLHVIEHIGLGRYGDPVDSQGTAKASEELSRVLAPGGNLYVSLPVGRPRIEFNAHRVFDPDAFVRLFPDLALVEFTLVDDKGALHRHAATSAASKETFGCGLFHFTRPT